MYGKEYNPHKNLIHFVLMELYQSIENSVAKTIMAPLCQLTKTSVRPKHLEILYEFSCYCVFVKAS